MPRYDKSRKSETTSLKQAIEEMLSNYKIKDRFDENKLITDWEQIMGTPIANRTEKLFFKKKVLHVKLNSPALRQELTIAKKKVLDILHEKFSEDVVKDIRFY